MTTDRAMARREQNLERVNQPPLTELVPAWDRAKIDVIKRTVAPGLTDMEFAWFGQFCAETGLDPLKREVYAIPYGRDQKRRVSFQVAIDGFRRVAQQHPHFRGVSAPQWCGEDGVWRDVWLSDKPPAACKVGIFIAGAPAPTEAVVLYREFRRDTDQWRSMAAHMLAVRAESHAFRKAFGQTFSAVDLLEPGDEPRTRARVSSEQARADAALLYAPDDDAIEGTARAVEPDVHTNWEDEPHAEFSAEQAAFRDRLNRAGERERPARTAAPKLDPAIPVAGIEPVTMKKLHARAGEYGMDHAALRDFAAGLLEVGNPGEWSMKQLTQAQAQQVYAALGELVDVEPPDGEWAPEE